LGVTLLIGLFGLAAPANADDQTEVGAGNQEAAQLAADSPLVRSADRFISRQAEQIRDQALRHETVDAITNRQTCVRHRAGITTQEKDRLVRQLLDQHLVRESDGDLIPGGLRAGIFPLLEDGTDCPRLPQPFFSAPGSSYGGHHSYPGGLVVHETFNDLSNLQLAAGYRRVYGSSRRDGLPIVGVGEGHDIEISRDVTIGAPLWHDWAKTFVFQWNADGSEFIELPFGGAGDNDDYGRPGDSRTGGHHIIGVAEAMKRGLSPDFVIAQASAHSVPTSGNQFKVVNWLRAGAILAHIDPVARGYLVRDGQGLLRLPPLRHLGEIDLVAAGQLNVLAEYVLHNISDSDFTLTGPAVSIAQILLRELARHYGYDPLDVGRYNRRYRNPALSYLSAERLLIMYSQGGIDLITEQLDLLRDHGIL
jgi:hypothetical protein